MNPATSPAMSDVPEPPLWLADPSVAWSIVLDVGLSAEVPGPAIEQRLRALNQRLGSPRPTDLVGPGADLHGADLLRAVSAATGTAAPVAAAVAGRRLVVAGEHQHVDGLGLLAVLTELTGLPATSAARGLGPRRDQPPFRTELRTRLTEVAVAPPARVAGTGTDPAARGSTFADRLLDRRVGVTELVHAAARAVVAFNRPRSGGLHRVAIAVGASEVPGAAPVVADNSALLRLRSAERATKEEIRHFLHTAPTVPSPGRSLEGSRPVVARAAALAVRVLGRRLGSTLTLSHLGDVDAPVADLAFYPVSGGASGVSLGAVTHRGRTRITARGRSDRHSQEDLDALLDAVADALAGAAPDRGSAPRS
jgi:hypothetical protein